jgi:hypothetical protein
MSPSPRPQRGASQTPRSHPVKQAPPPEAVAADPSTAADNGVAGDLASDSSEPSEVATLELELTEANVTEVWSRAVGQLEGMAAEPARQFAHVRLPEANRIQVTFKAGSAFNKTICEQPGNLTEFEESLRRVVGRRVRVSFAVEDGPAAAREKQPPAQVVSPHQRLMEITKHPMIRRAGELFGATPTEVIDPPDRS